MNPYDDLPLVLDVPAVAAVLGTGERVVREEIAAGRLEHVRVGRLIRVPRHCLLSYLGMDVHGSVR